MDDAPDPRDPIRRIAHDAAADSVPLDSRVTFDEWSKLVGDVADDIERTLRAEGDA